MIEFDLTIQAMRKFKYLVDNPSPEVRAQMITNLGVLRRCITVSRILGERVKKVHTDIGETIEDATLEMHNQMTILHEELRK